MQAWKIGFWVVLVTLICMVLIGFYTIMDQGVTMTYMREGYIDTESDLNTIIEIVNTTDLSKEEIIESLNSHNLYEFLDLESDTFALDRVLLCFENDTLRNIKMQW